MDLKTIRALSKILTDAELTSLEVQEGDLTIKLTKENTVVMQQGVAMPAASVMAEQPMKEGIVPVGVEADPGLDFNDAHTVDSPMVGVFYGSPNPADAPYVQVGSKVKKGDVVCIIEAMKLFNEITAKQDGEVVDICVADGDVVEYGQTLFKIV